MQSPVLSNRAVGRVAAIQPLCVTIPAPPERAQTAQNTPKELEDRDLIVVGELRLNGSVAPVYAIRADSARFNCAGSGDEELVVFR